MTRLLYLFVLKVPLNPNQWINRFCVVTEQYHWLGGLVVRALDLRLEIAGSIPAAVLSSATLDKLFTHIVQRL